jgi:hypothetical protein
MFHKQLVCRPAYVCTARSAAASGAFHCICFASVNASLTFAVATSLPATSLLAPGPGMSSLRPLTVKAFT